MSFAGFSISSLVSELVYFQPQRNMGGFVADVTVEEDHTDELTITEHPVEQGAPITDHAYKRPSRLIVKAGWSNSSLSAGGDPNYASTIYSQLLNLQASRQPFSVVTGKRSYDNMLFASLQVTTDAESENVLLLTAILQQVIIVQTQTTTVPPTDNQANPQSTAATQNSGTKSLGSGANYNDAAGQAAGALPVGF